MSEVLEKENVLDSGLKGSSQSQSSEPGLVNLLTGKDPEKAIGTVIDRLVSEREQWESKEFSSSNERLYGLLATCYTLNNTMIGSDATAKCLRKGLANYIAEKGYQFTDSTALIAKIVRCIFGVDRRRVSVYVAALKIAKEEKVGVLDLPRWLKAQGGVEEVKRSAASAKKTKTLTDKVKEGSIVLEAPSLASVQSDALNAQFSNEKLSEGVVLLATREDDGSFSIRRVIQADSVVKAAIAACAQLSANERKKKEIEAQAAELERARTEAQKELKKAA
jgi:hypothetical protein